MVTVAVRVRRKGLAAAAAGLALAAVLLLGRAPAAVQAFLGHRAETKCATAEDGAAWLREQGWEVEPEPIETLQFLLPAELEEPYRSYNELQLSQGFDLTRCCGKQVSRCTYTVTNYPGQPEGVQANLYICEDVPVAGDVCSSGARGFQEPLLRTEE